MVGIQRRIPRGILQGNGLMHTKEFELLNVLYEIRDYFLSNELDRDGEKALNQLDDLIDELESEA